MRPRLAGVVLALTVVGPALGAEPDDDRIAMAVMELGTSGNIDRSQVEGLELVLADVLSRTDHVRAVMPSEIEALLGLEARKQLMGCEADTSCLAEIGGALGATYLLRPQVAQVGGTWLIQLALIHTEDARTLARATREASDDTQLVRQLRSAAEELLAAVPAPTRSEATTASATPEPGGEAPAPAVRPAPRLTRSQQQGRQITFWLGLGAGTLLVAGGGSVWGINADRMRRHNEAADLWQSWLDEPSGVAPVTTDLLSRTEARRVLDGERIGVLLMALGAGAIIGGVSFGSPTGGAPVQAALLPLPGGAQATLTARWGGP
ncbi:MAG: hypothetical protein P1V51_04640 [Deltaproteobacteria bacterium]|nr:hypothetical protein [Deltaproteobacteria bacterium]